MHYDYAPIDDLDIDSLFMLPLEIIPLQTKSLRSARMLKNHRLETVVEMFTDKKSGSGQIEIDQLPNLCGWKQGSGHPDCVLLKRLSRLPSYDVYSLRLVMREKNIPINDIEALQLSEEKSRELAIYMKEFTRPLVARIYGGDSSIDVEEVTDVISLFRDPDIQKVRRRLNAMADMLGIKLEDVPRFLEDYGDTFLSFAFYRNCLDRLVPLLENLIGSFDEIRKNYQLKQDHNMQKNCKQIEDVLNNLSADLTGRFEMFDRKTQTMWDDMSAEKFREVKDMIESYHLQIGAILTCLTVKMNAWVTAFPNPDAGSPVKRGEFVMSQMKPGIARMKSMIKI